MKLELEIHREELATQNEDLRRSNALLQSANERFALLYDRAPVAYFTIAADGRLVEVNTAGASLVGIPRRFLFGRSFDDLIAASTRAAFRRFREGVVSGIIAPAHDNMLISGHGLVPVRIEAAMLSTGGECLLCVADESKRRENEAEQRRALGKRMDAERRASLARLAAGVARDYDAVVATIRTQSELLLLEPRLPGAAAGNARAMRAAAEHAARLSQQLLAFAAATPTRLVGLDLSAVVRASTAALERHAVARSLHFDLDDALPPIEGDAVQVARMLANLVANAAEATARGGRIFVRTRVDHVRVVLEVVDDGHGMDERTRAYVCEPFFTTKPGRSGFGLAVVDGHARGHRAELVIESRPHHGTLVRLSFPPAAANDVGAP